MCQGTIQRSLGNEDVWDLVSTTKALQCDWEVRTHLCQNSTEERGLVVGGPQSADGVGGRDWASEGGPMLGKMWEDEVAALERRLLPGVGGDGESSSFSCLMGRDGLKHGT